MSKKSKKKRKKRKPPLKEGPKAARPEPSASPSKTVAAMVRDGDISSDPKVQIDPVLYDFEGKKVQRGNADPGVIGPDDNPEFSFRPDTSYPDLPSQVRKAEHQYVLPLAKFIADSIGITVIDDYAYNKVLPALQSRSLFVVLNLYKTVVDDGIATWFGLVLMCRRHPVALVQFKERLSTEQVGISLVKCWSAAGQKYFLFGDREGRKFLSREETSAVLLNYLKREGILPNI
jgi:hypothetical protein